MDQMNVATLILFITYFLKLCLGDSWCYWGMECGQCSAMGFTIRHVKTNTYLVAKNEEEVGVTTELSGEMTEKWIYDVRHRNLINVGYQESALAVYEPMLSELNEVYLAPRMTSMDILNVSFAHPGVNNGHSANTIGFIADVKLHFVKYGDQIKTAIFGLNYDPYTDTTLLMPIVHDSFYAVCKSNDQSFCDCMTKGGKAG